jgi:hypothetical protein
MTEITAVVKPSGLPKTRRRCVTLDVKCGCALMLQSLQVAFNRVVPKFLQGLMAGVHDDPETAATRREKLDAKRAEFLDRSDLDAFESNDADALRALVEKVPLRPAPVLQRLTPRRRMVACSLWMLQSQAQKRAKQKLRTRAMQLDRRLISPSAKSPRHLHRKF